MTLALLIVEQQYFDVVAPLSSAAAWATLALVPALAIIRPIGLWLIRRQPASLQMLSEAAQRLASGQRLGDRSGGGAIRDPGMCQRHSIGWPAICGDSSDYWKARQRLACRRRRRRRP